MNLRRRAGKFALALFVACVPAAEMGAASDAAAAVEMRVVGGRLEGGVRTLRVKRDDRIVMRFTSDEKLTLHLHGYDVEVALSPAMKATLIVDARIVGRFPLAAHFASPARERTLLYLEVRPE